MTRCEGPIEYVGTLAIRARKGLASIHSAMETLRSLMSMISFALQSVISGTFSWLAPWRQPRRYD